MSEFFKTKKFKIIIAIVALLFGMLLYSASTEGVENIPKNLLSIITTPFQKATASVSKKVGDVFDELLNASNNARENEVLKEEINKLNKKLVEYEKVKEENEELKKVSGIKENYPDFEMTNASVISRDPADRYGSFIIDKGTLHGVNLNNPVITNSGLIGFVSDVSPINARVKTILSPSIDVSAFEITKKQLGVVSGDIQLSQKGLCKLSILSEETSLKSGDMIVTAGSSGKFPKGIPVGKVKEVFNETHGITMYATIEPMEPIEDVATVQVITKFLGQGSGLSDFVKK